MATFDGLDLWLDKGAGGIYELGGVASYSGFHYFLDGDGDVSLVGDSKVAIVRGLPASSFEDCVSEGREAANRALDVGATRWAEPAFLDHDKQPYICWWHELGRTRMRILSETPMTMRVSATVEVRDKDGNLIAQPPPSQPTWHESLRYYRISEGTGDLFDSFRNLYLAIEALLSTVDPPIIAPAGGPEPEGKWLKRTLGGLAARVDLQPYAPPGSLKLAHNAIFDELYTALRTAIFHAKRGKAVWLPQEWGNRERIIEARQRYANLYRALAKEFLGIEFLNGGLTKHGFANSSGALMDSFQVYVSDDPTRHVGDLKGEYEIAPAGGKVILLPTARAEEFEGDWVAGVTGTGSGDEIMNGVSCVRRFGSLLRGELAMVENLAGALDVSGVDILEVTLLVVNRNFGAPRQDFAS